LFFLAAAALAMRLRVRCGSAYLLGDLQWCMVHVPEHILSIRELAGHISRLLELNVRGGNGTEPQVSIGGFLIPYGEEVRNVLRDDEVVDVAPMDVDCSTLTNAASQAPQVTCKRGPKDVNGADAIADGIAPDKRARRGGAGANGHAAIAAIGWQPPEEIASTKVPVVAEAACAESKRTSVKTAEAVSSVPAKVSTAAAPKARAVALPTSSSENESDEDDSSEEEEEEEDPLPKQPKGAKAAVAASGKPARDQQALNNAQTAARTAQAAALATCSSEHGTAPERGGRGDTDDQGCSLFVCGLPYHLVEADFRRHFEYYGAVDNATIVKNNNTGKAKGFGFIEFAKAVSREKALADGPTQQIAGKQVEIKPRHGKGGKAKGKGGKDGGKFGSKGVKGGKGDNGGGKAGAGGKSPRNADVGSMGCKETQATPSLPSTLATGTNSAGKQKHVPAMPANEDIGEEEAEMQRQMAALGLPVSFTATEARADESDDGEDDEVSEEDSGQ